MEKVMNRAQVLIEAIPYIRAFHGKTFVIKYGGHAMVDQELKRSVMLDIVLLKYLGLNPVLVHGGGPEITQMLEKTGKKSISLHGQRVTDQETMEIVNMVLAGKINKELVTLLNHYGVKAAGLSGQDGGLLQAVKKNMPGGEDLGFVGEVKRVNPELLHTLLAKGYIPVVATVGVGEEGENYNINADTVAGELAAALPAEKLIILTDVEGIHEDPADNSTLISNLKIEKALEMIADGRIGGGMIPKVHACIHALRHG